MSVRKSKCKHPIGANIKRIREAHGMPQLVLAERLGVKRERVSNWECEENNPTLECIVALADILNCSIDELFGYIHVMDDKKRRLLVLLDDLDDLDIDTLTVTAEAMKERHQRSDG